ncbi:MAG: threonine ammonia-lyase, biosynthetic [Pseudomonadales bacterium]|nr:threonine ammonia-lyase, biosynthetic [Pseudomonadales bacterium]
MTENYIRRILEANVYDVAQQSPLDDASNLSARLGVRVLLKREDLQPVFCFKLRGAYNKISRLAPDVRQRGVVTASAGNHAQGVALAATRLGIKSVIVMGRNTPQIKVNAVASLGGEVVLHGDNYDEAAAHAEALMAAHGYTYVHPFDDPDVIAGQGTIGMEILRQHTGRLDAVFLPVGGGGLISGVAAYIKYLRPEVRIIGVEAEGAAGMWAALQAGKRVKLDPGNLDQFADGTAVLQVGRETFRIARKHVDDVIRVTTDEICAAIKDIFEDTRSISEPSGALAVAGIKKYLACQTAQTGVDKNSVFAAVVSGANVNFDRLRHISERAEIGEKREMLLGVTIAEQPGSFKKFCAAIGKRSITEFNYRYSGAAGARVLVGLATSPDDNDRRKLLDKLASKYDIVDLSDNEVAVLHVRHMVGGRIPDTSDERLLRFEFPERPGALMNFLSVLGQDFNISMFHYRNHGSAWGRVLVGVQVPTGQLKQFRASLRLLGYRYWDESDNPAYRMFLAAEFAPS